MAQRIKMLSVLLVVFLIIGVPTPSSGFGMMKGGGGGSSSVGQILAAGLITGMLMDSGRSPMMQALHHPMIGGYGFLHSRHAMPHMLAPRIPMMNHYDMMYRPVMYRPRYMMNQALITEAKRHQALASRLSEEIRALEAQESILEAYLARYQKGAAPALNELLDQEDSIPAAALILGTELMDTEGEIENAHIRAQPQIVHPEMFQPEASEPESRYLLPRIVRHFVQRLMRRAEHH